MAFNSPGGTLRSQVLQKVGQNLKQSQQRDGGSGDASKLRENQGRSLQKSPFMRKVSQGKCSNAPVLPVASDPVLSVHGSHEVGEVMKALS